MGVRMPITREKIRNHFQYGFWKYLLLVVLCLFLWNLLFTTTRYRAPESLKMEFFADGYSAPEADAALADLLQHIHAQVMPDMEEVTYVKLGADDPYGAMQLTVWASAGQGDVFLLGHDRFLSLAKGGAMVDLQPMLDDGLLHAQGLDLAGGRVMNDETGRTAQYGIPADGLPGLDKYGLARQGAVLSVLAGGGNQAQAVRFLDYLLTHMGEETSGS